MRGKRKKGTRNNAGKKVRGGVDWSASFETGGVRGQV